MRVQQTSQQGQPVRSPVLESPRQFLLSLFEAAVARAHPRTCLAQFLPKPPDPAKGRTIVLGAGKAGGAMAQALEAVWPTDAPLSGLVVTRYAHLPPGYVPGRVEVVQASHPLPDTAGSVAAQRMMALGGGLTAGLSEHDLVICLISGGGSALLAAPVTHDLNGRPLADGGLTLAQKQAINKALLRSGANISEMNCVRKHLSAVKGGRLAAMCTPARVVTLCISDVPGDDPAVIASGPTVPDATTCADALAVLQRYKIAVPRVIESALRAGLLETPKPGDACFAGQTIHMIATPQQALEAAARAAHQAGIAAHILSDEIEGESREVGKVHAALARQVALRNMPFEKPCVILSGGETTVTVKGNGRGGRALEFLMGAVIALRGQDGVHILACDTDGIDGSEDNAGAFVAPDSLKRAKSLELVPAQFLDNNDAYSFFYTLGDLIVTGPTCTNVNDFRAILMR
jgi:glycerate 2-kinase